jgi:hypothetical protein
MDFQLQRLYNVALHGKNIMYGKYKDWGGGLFQGTIQTLFGEFEKKHENLSGNSIEVQTGYISNTIKSLAFYKLVQCLQELIFEIFIIETHYSSRPIVLVH